MRALASAALLLAASPLAAQVQPAPPSPIPTLDEYGIIGLILLLGIAAAVFVHSRSK